MTLRTATRRAFLYPAATVAASGWWLSGGISAANVIAAYQPKGAASLAASYTDLTGNGNTAAEGVAPTLDANGWNFTGTQYLDTGVTHANGYTVIALGSFSSISGATYWIGARSSSTTRLQLGQNSGTALLNHGGSLNGATLSVDTEYVMAQAGGTGYIDSSGQGSSGAWSGTNTRSLYIGGDNNAGTFQFGFSGYVCAVAIYDTALASDQIAAVSTAMAAL